MKHNKQSEYDQKMMSIQCKFKFICQNYQKIKQELHMKNKIIEELNAKIQYLQDQLDISSKYVGQLQVKLEKKEGLNKLSSHKYLKSRLIVPQSIENQHFQNKKHNEERNYHAVQSNASIKYQLNGTYNRLNNLPPKIHKSSSLQNLKEEEIFSKRLQQLKSKISAQSNYLSTNNQLKFKDITNSQQKGPKIMKIKSQKDVPCQQKGLTKTSNQSQNIQSTQNIKTLHKIWQQRDIQIFKMDEIFQNINDKLKQYEHQNIT